MLTSEQWQEAEQTPVERPAPKDAPARHEAPWVEHPVMVPPTMLRWQKDDDGPRPLEQSPHAIGARQILQGCPPDGTDYAREITDRQAGCHGKPAAFAELVHGMKRDGWKGGPIIGWINRRGEVVIHDGWHRSAAALACGLAQIPVAVHGRDEDWIAFRHAVADLNNGRKLYQPIFHPDFAWPCWRKDTGRRIALIARWLTDEGAEAVCDLGCHAGTISHGLARAGFSVVGIDQNPKAVRVARLGRAMTYFGSEAEFHVGVRVPPGGADAVVCLSAINHAMVKDMETANRVLESIGACTRLLATDCPAPGDPVGGDTEWADPERMIEWITSAGWVLLDRADRGADLQRTMTIFRKE